MLCTDSNQPGEHMQAISRTEKQQFSNILGEIRDDQVRYFYLMLGSALAQKDDPDIATQSPANTGPDHIAALRRRLNGL
jgi:hypothetical protein